MDFMTAGQGVDLFKAATGGPGGVVADFDREQAAADQVADSLARQPEEELGGILVQEQRQARLVFLNILGQLGIVAAGYVRWVAEDRIEPFPSLDRGKPVTGNEAAAISYTQPPGVFPGYMQRRFADVCQHDLQVRKPRGQRQADTPAAAAHIQQHGTAAFQISQVLFAALDKKFSLWTRDQDRRVDDKHQPAELGSFHRVGERLAGLAAGDRILDVLQRMRADLAVSVENALRRFQPQPVPEDQVGFARTVARVGNGSQALADIVVELYNLDSRSPSSCVRSSLSISSISPARKPSRL